MRIVVNARFLTQRMTGVQRYGVELSKKFIKIFKDDVVFVCPHNILDKETAELLGVKVIGTHTGHLWEQWDLPLFLKRHGSPLLVNFSNTAPVLYRNKVTTIHDITFVRYPNTFSKLFVMFYRTMIPLVIKTSRHLFTVSEFSKNEISSFYHVNKDRLSVVYNAVSEDFKAIEDEGLQSKKYFMAVSSVKENKNFIYILEAFKQFSLVNKDVELYVIGDLKSKSFKTLDVSQYTDNERVKILGRVSDEDLIKYYSNALAFLFPSLYEGFGIPPLEAQACGCPAICAKASCLPEVFGDSVLYCDPYKVESLVAAMTAISENDKLRTELEEKGYKNVLNYSWEKSATSMAAILKDLVGEMKR